LPLSKYFLTIADAPIIEVFEHARQLHPRLPTCIARARVAG
jgi:hypothetical protein